MVTGARYFHEGLTMGHAEFRDLLTLNIAKPGCRRQGHIRAESHLGGGE